MENEVVQPRNSIALQIDQTSEAGESPTIRTAQFLSRNVGSSSFNLKMMSTSPRFCDSPSDNILQNSLTESSSKKRVIVPPLSLNDPGVVSLKANLSHSESPFVAPALINIHARRFKRKNRDKQISRSGSKNGFDGDSINEELSPSMLKEYKYRSNTRTFSSENVSTRLRAGTRTFSAIVPKGSESQPFSTSFDNSQIGSVKSAQIGMTQRAGEENGKRKSLESNGWGPSITGRTYETYSVSMESLDLSVDEPPISVQRMKVRKRFRRGLLAMYFIGIMFSLRNKVQICGALRPVEYFEAFEPIKIVQEEKPGFLPIRPTSSFSVIWTMIMTILLILNVILTPIYVSFIDGDHKFFYYVNLIFDVGFGIDIALNFMTAYYDVSHELVTSFREIALNYLQVWFWIDIVAVIPFDHIISTTTHSGNTSSATRVNKLFRVLRFPRLYKMLRVFRLVKMVRLFSNNSYLNKLLKKLNLNLNVITSIKLFVNFVLINHIFGCLWFFIARLDDFNLDTWVAREDLLDKDLMTQYIASIYWSFQIFLGVGYGDITPESRTEKTLFAFWPFISVSVYSYVLENISRIFLDLNKRNEILQDKIQVFKQFGNKVKLPDFLTQKVSRFFELNHKYNVHHWSDPEDQLKSLPISLKTSLLLYSYYDLIKNINMLQINKTFTASLLLHFKLLRLNKEEVLYREGDPAHESISIGSVKFVTSSIQGIYSMAEGTHFGEIELLEEVKRRNFCQAIEVTILLVCPKLVFLRLIKDFPEIESHFYKIFQIRKEQFERRLAVIQSREVQTDEQDDPPHSKPLLKTTEYINNVLLAIAKREKEQSEEEEMGIKFLKTKKRLKAKKRRERYLSNANSRASESFESERGLSHSNDENLPGLPSGTKVSAFKRLYNGRSPDKNSSAVYPSATGKDMADKDLDTSFFGKLRNYRKKSREVPKVVKVPGRRASKHEIILQQKKKARSRRASRMISPDALNPEYIDNGQQLITDIHDIIESPKDDTNRELMPILSRERIENNDRHKYIKGSYFIGQTIQTEEANLLDEESAKYQDDFSHKQKKTSSHNIDTQSSGTITKLVSLGKGSFLTSDLSSMIKEKKPKITYLPNSNKMVPIIESRKTREDTVQETGWTNTNRTEFIFSENELDDVDTDRKDRRKSQL